MSQGKKISFIIPAYNEAKTIAELIQKVLDIKIEGGFLKELIVVNDSSKDNTEEIVRNLAKTNKEIRVLNNEKNLGKSQTVKNGILSSTGNYVVIQDADLEYEPEEIPMLLKYLVNNKLDVVYGNRFGKKNKVIYFQNYVGNKFLSLISNLFTYPKIKTWIPDMEVCYKLIDGNIARELAKGIESKSNFGFEPEITAKLSKYKKNGKNLKFAVLPISYYPRSVAEGKKMKAVQDGMKALKEIIKYNLFG